MLGVLFGTDLQECRDRGVQVCEQLSEYRHHCGLLQVVLDLLNRVCGHRSFLRTVAREIKPEF